jgi:glycosyltransferase involved in cell wall biosynthesis
MNKDTTYSFIIPHKNCPDLLQRCINSIPERKDIQIIIVDDNSDDDKKPTIVRSDVEIILLGAEQSQGAGRARNVGINKSKGQWLLFPDSDDYYCEGFLNVLDKFVLTTIDVVYFNFEYKDGVTGASLPSLHFRGDFDCYDGSKSSEEAIRFHHNVPWTKMVKKAFVIENKIQFEEVPNGNDILFSITIGSLASRIEVIKLPLYVYLRNTNSITQRQLTENDAFCVLLHIIQLNCFYKSKGHPEWCMPIFKKTVFYIKVCGLSIFHLFKKRMTTIYHHRKDWSVQLR